MTDVKRRTFVWHFDSPLEAIWPVLADTARFNEAANLPKHHIDEIAQADGSVRYMARAQKGPFKLEWEDKPVNWVINRWFRHCRYFQSGPLKFLCANLEFFPEDGGCRGEYTIEAEASFLSRQPARPPDPLDPFLSRHREQLRPPRRQRAGVRGRPRRAGIRGQTPDPGRGRHRAGAPPGLAD